MGLRTSASARAGLHGQMKLARLLEMPERAVEELVRKLEANPLFARLRSSGAITVAPYSEAHFATRRAGTRQLSASSDALSGLVDGKSRTVEIIQRVGQERFEEFFLGDDGLPDEERALRCELSLEEARELREFVDRLYIRAEFEQPSPETAEAKVFSLVAGIKMEDGRPTLAFFHREVWKGRYRIDTEKIGSLIAGATPRDRRRMETFLRRLEFLDHRKSTLHRVLTTLLETQRAFLASGDPALRHTLTQRSLARDLEVAPSVLNRLISNKSVRMPWGIEAPLRIFVPSAKTLLRDRLYEHAVANPGLSDAALAEEMARLHGAKLSRRSIAQYRKELGLGGRGRRGPAES